MNTMDLKTRAEQWRYYHRTAPTSASHDVTLFLDRLEQLERDLANAQEAAANVEEERDRLRERCQTLASNHEYRVEEMAALRKERDELKQLAAINNDIIGGLLEQIPRQP